ncbi:hypothetical protein L195_g054691 [Trifolium pratense]|uniref:Uncharacterized protein n=1 Tax=Trifolium pratense TaxID=57577 RepID=A0A2K3KHI1_TRIPR|nr:hypothetical protein L195_g054691 [Trifolium pratense]
MLSYGRMDQHAWIDEHVFNVLPIRYVEQDTSLADVSGKSPLIGLCPKCRAEAIGPALGPVQNTS